MKEATFGIFGNFFILHRVASGGMAEIFLARPASTSANGRILVLKRILPQATLDPEFISMFQSEIKVSMGFNHANLVQIYDFGKCEGKHFIAMEYIEGKNLRELTSKFMTREEPVPVELAVSVIAQTAAGLQYAHTFKNHVTGESLNIVHRDISPQNILISYEGNVKIIDFGIAKAESIQADKTRAGCIKGKVSYLSPEQLFQQDLDGRSDIFSLGAVLWELLTGHKLFHQAGQSELEIMGTIARCDATIFPPSLYNSKVAASLDEIVMRALSKSRDDRYENAEALYKVLSDFLWHEFPHFNQRRLSEYMKEIFQEELVDERKQIKELNREAQAVLEGCEVTTQLVVTPPPMLHVPKMSALQSRSYSQAPEFASSAGATAAEPFEIPTPLGIHQKVREQFYIKLTFGRALALLVYAGTLIILRVDHEQRVLNSIFGPWNSQAGQFDQQQLKADSSLQAAVKTVHEQVRQSAVPSSKEEVIAEVIEDPVDQAALARAAIEKRRAERKLLAMRVPANRNLKSVWLRIRLVLKSGPAATAVYVNQRKLDLRYPSLQVPLNQKISVQVQRRGALTVVKNLVIKPEALKLPSSYDFSVNLY